MYTTYLVNIIYLHIQCQIFESPTDIEVICVELNLQHPIICCVIYIPLNSLSYIMTHYLVFLLLLVITYLIMILSTWFSLEISILADIEWNTLSSQSNVSQQFCDLIFDIGLDQLINT